MPFGPKRQISPPEKWGGERAKEADEWPGWRCPALTRFAHLAAGMAAGTLVVQAKRTDAASQDHQSEFRYGRFTRACEAPAGR
jgi:hypothetical protein